jgi:hypothetical protein
METTSLGPQPAPEIPIEVSGPGKRQPPTEVLPTDRLTVDRQIAVLRAFTAVYESNGEKPVSNTEAGDVVHPTKMAASTVLTTNAFFCAVGLLIRQESGMFSVAPEAVAFLTAERGLAPEAAPEKMRPIFEKQWFTRLLIHRVRLGATDLDTVYKILGDACSAAKEYQRRIEMLVEYLCFIGILKREGNQVQFLPVGHSSDSAGDTQSAKPTTKNTEEQTEDQDLERHTLTLDPKSKRRIVVCAPHTVTAKELERIKNWLSFQIIIEADQP